MTTPATDPTFDVFISHATADDAAVNRLASALTAAGLRVWVDHQQLKHGDDWSRSIQKALQACPCAIFALTKTSAKSDECAAEYRYVMSNNKKLFVAYIEAPDPGEFPWRLTTIQYTNLTKDYDANIARLVDAFHDRVTLTTLEAEQPADAPRTAIIETLLFTAPDKIPNRPRGWVGREDVLPDILAKLAGEDDFAGRVLVQAYGGTGKTALAKKVAESWLKSAPKQRVLWLAIGSSDISAIFGAIARQFGQTQQLASLTGAEQANFIRDLLDNVHLLVLDDAWNGQALREVLLAVPDALPVLVTSRSRYELDELVELGNLAPDEALKLLGYHAKQDLSASADAATLCRRLGYLAFAIEIAGNLLKSRKQTPAELLTDYENRLHELEMKASHRGRESVTALLETSLQTLDNEVRAVFMTFGSFFAPQLTAELLMLYFVGEPNISDEMMEQVRRNNPQIAALEDSQLRELIRHSILAQVDSTPVQQALMHLQDNGLAEYFPATDTTAPAFRIHDLSYAYAVSQTFPHTRHRAMNACLTYAERYEEPGWDSFRPLLPALETILGAAEWALNGGSWEQGKSLVYSIEGGSRILTLLGYYGQEISLLETIASAAQQRNDQGEYGNALGALGNAYFHLGDYPRAIQYHEQVLKISQEMGDKSNEGRSLGNLGNAYFSLGDYPRAIQYHEQALTIQRAIGDRHGEGSDLGNLGNAYNSLGDYPRAIQYYEQALAIARQIGDKYGEGNRLGNLGNAYNSLGDYPRAIQYHEQALAISRTIGNKAAEGSILGNLGNAYRNLGDYPHAIQYHEQALAISRQIGDRSGEGSDLGNLGNAYFSLGDYPRAIQYYEQALAIARQIGNKSNEGNQLGNLGNAYHSLGDYPRAIQYLEQVLKISQEMGDKRNEGNTLGNLGNAYHSLGDYPRAIHYYEQALAISRAIGDRNGESNHLNNLGVAYEMQADYPRALDYYTQARDIRVKLGLTHMVEKSNVRIAEVQAKMAGGDPS